MRVITKSLLLKNRSSSEGALKSPMTLGITRRPDDYMETRQWRNMHFLVMVNLLQIVICCLFTTEHLGVHKNSLKRVHEFQIKLLEMLVFKESGKPECPERNLSEQRREPTTNSTHIWCRRRDLNPGHIGGSECSHHCTTPARRIRLRVVPIFAQG